MHLPVASLRQWLDKYVTVEPLLACFYIASTINGIMAQNLILYKSSWPDAEPPSTQDVFLNETYAQSRVAGISTWKPLILFLLPVVGVACAGPWSDKHGRRRPLLLIPMVGQILSDFMLAASVIWWRETSPEITTVMETLPAALTGGRGVLAIGVTSYLADVTTPEERTMRMGAMIASVFVATPVGSALFGVCSPNIGFLGTFLMCAAINAVGFLYAFFRLKEPKDLKATHTFAMSGMFKMMLNGRLFTVAIALLFVLGPLQGEFSVLYLFLRYKFHWTEVDFSLYTTYKLVMVFGGTVVTVLIMCKLLKLRDSTIGIISCLTQLVASLLYLVVNVGWLMYVVPIAEMFHGASLAMQKSIASKMVDPSELGKLNSMLSIIEAVIPLIIFPLYNKVYQYTLEIFPAAFFGLSAILTVPALFIFSWLYIVTRKEENLKVEPEPEQKPADSGKTS